MKAGISYIIGCILGLTLFVSAAGQRSVAVYWGPLTLPPWATQQCHQWIETYGAWNNEVLRTMQPTPDGGFILAGHSDGLPTRPLWLLKANANGSQQWQKSYERPYVSEARSVQPTTDGGYIIVGYAGTANASNDLWALKVDATGNLQWQKTLGGSGNDEAYCVTQTGDGGYFIAASTTSADGDVTGGADGWFNYWIVKLNSTGDLVWQKKLETTQRPYSVKQTVNGEFLIAGDSPFYFNQTANPEESSDEGAFCIIKLDASGSFLWQKTLGTYKLDAAHDIIQTTDGNYVAAGYSNTYNSITGDNFDGLVIKIDGNGNILWQTKIDYTLYDDIKSIKQTADGGFIFCGAAVYPWNDWYGTYDPSDFWMGKLDAAGQLTWQGAFGGEREGSAVGIAQTADGGYVVAGNYMTPDNMSVGISANLDYMLMKLAPGCTLRQVSGYYKRRQYVTHWQGGSSRGRARSATTLQANSSTGPEVLFRDTLNRLIAAVSSGGMHPLGGDVTAAVWVEIDQPTTYLRRHYEITPDVDAATATGTIKLYFSQEDFNAYNEVVSSERRLPSAPGDAAGIANLRIVKYSGMSNTETGLPGSYAGNATVIVPGEIVWNNGQQIWEVGFDVSGFSGFFATDAITAGSALPVTFGAITAFLKGGELVVDWTSESETNNAYYQIQASTDGENFITISDKIISHAKDGHSDTPLHYTFTHTFSGLFGASLLLLLSLVSGSRSRLRTISFVLSAFIMVSAIACNKSSNDFEITNGDTLLIRIAQTDQDGVQTYSKIIKVAQQ